MWKSKDLPELLRAVAQYRDYGHLDRIPQWEERLRVNELELRQFAALPHEDAQPQFAAGLPAAAEKPAAVPLSDGAPAPPLPLPPAYGGARSRCRRSPRPISPARKPSPR